MNLKLPLAVIVAVPLLCGMRDPFVPIEDPCHHAQLSLWRYRGAAASGDRLIGIVQRGDDKWQRVEKDAVLHTGWRVLQVTPENLMVETGTGCEPQRWQWTREGTTKNEQDKPANTAASGAAEPGEKRHAGGGRRAGGPGVAKPGRP
ncbi:MULTISPECIES: HofP DNA utilization family protein [Enterobacteriaceae]|uniref:HofP DNA utilization family protein n=1 Tax=Enterobacteriaceae TaxID=543 RepID=UPI001A22A06B|nr:MULTISPECIES: HofP DNA utilization family protein [unclassified Klebsiella]HAT3953779.1 DUF2531 family protein [Kluyvera ascorbata]